MINATLAPNMTLHAPYLVISLVAPGYLALPVSRPNKQVATKTHAGANANCGLYASNPRHTPANTSRRVRRLKYMPTKHASASAEFCPNVISPKNPGNADANSATVLPYARRFGHVRHIA